MTQRFIMIFWHFFLLLWNFVFIFLLFNGYASAKLWLAKLLFVVLSKWYLTLYNKHDQKLILEIKKSLCGHHKFVMSTLGITTLEGLRSDCNWLVCLYLCSLFILDCWLWLQLPEQPWKGSSSRRWKDVKDWPIYCAKDTAYKS